MQIDEERGSKIRHDRDGEQRLSCRTHGCRQTGPAQHADGPTLKPYLKPLSPPTLNPSTLDGFGSFRNRGPEYNIVPLDSGILTIIGTPKQGTSSCRKLPFRALWYDLGAFRGLLGARSARRQPKASTSPSSRTFSQAQRKLLRAACHHAESCRRLHVDA